MICFDMRNSEEHYISIFTTENKLEERNIIKNGKMSTKFGENVRDFSKKVRFFGIGIIRVLRN